VLPHPPPLIKFLFFRLNLPSSLDMKSIQYEENIKKKNFSSRYDKNAYFFILEKIYFCWSLTKGKFSEKCLA
jgi:hypothetical protein